MDYKYAIVTPVKNEEKFFPQTLESILRQEVRPAKWVIVNDGSTDSTGEIIRKAEAENDWIVGIHNSPTTHRRPGGEAVLAQGIKTLNLDDYDYFVRMDGDLSFGGDYFRKLFALFQQMPKLGIASGVCYLREQDKLVEEAHPRFHTRGPLKTYRTTCFRAIGGLSPELGWDTIDEVRANMLGWQTRSFPDLRIIHLRKTQTASGALRGLRNLGKASYYAGYHPLYLTARSVKTMFEKPYLVGGFSMLRGFFNDFLRGAPQVDDPALIRYLRQQQINRLMGRETIWR